MLERVRGGAHCIEYTNALVSGARSKVHTDLLKKRRRYLAIGLG